MLQTIPSFSFYNLKGELEDGEEEEESDIEDDKERVEVERVMAMGAQIQSLENKMNNMILTEEVNVKDDIWNMGFDQETFLARGLGIGSGDGGGSGGGGGCGSGGEFNSAGSGGDGEDKRGVEEYYKRMVEENPGNPLFLRNYAQFLYQVSFVMSLCFSHSIPI